MQKRKLVSIMLVLVMALTLLPMLPVAAADPTITGWTFTRTNATGTLAVDTTEARDGSCSVRISDETPFGAMKYISFGAYVPVEVGKTYRYSISIKTKNALNVITRVNSIASTVTSLVPFGSTSDWREFEFDYAHSDAATSQVFISVIIQDLADAVWLDDFSCYECEDGVPVGDNLFTNPSFEQNSVFTPAASENTQVAAIADADLESTYNVVKDATAFKSADLNRVLSGFEFSPMFRSHNIVVDGDLSEWASSKSPIITLPTTASQVKVYFEPEKPIDVTAKVQYAYDDEYFYVSVDVEDDTHVYIIGDTYWNADSVQLCIADVDETFGAEIGFCYDNDTNESHVYSANLTSDLLEGVLMKANRSGNHTTYEAAIPWSIKFGGGMDHSILKLPELFPFDLLVNDNDGDGRRYCVEIDGRDMGISTSRNNATFQMLRPLQDDQDWYAWVEGTRGPKLGETVAYQLTLVNNSNEDKTFTIRESEEEGAASQTISLKAGEGVRKGVERTFTTIGDQTLKFVISDGNITDTVTHAVVILPTVEEAQRIVTETRKKLAELDNLFRQCDAKGIVADYDRLKYVIIERFIQYMEDDIAEGDLTRMAYTDSKLTELYESAKKNLRDYLAGSAVPLDAPVPLTGEREIDGISIIGDVEFNDGTIEKRPVFLHGYCGDILKSRQDFHLFNDFGAYYTQVECGPRQWMTTWPGWSFQTSESPNSSNFPQYEVTLSDDSVSGNSLHVNYKDPFTSGKSVYFVQWLGVQPNTTYVLKLKLKGTFEGKFSTSYGINGVNTDRNYVPVGTYNDWQEFTKEYTTGPEQTTLEVYFLMLDKADFYVDDVSVKKKDDPRELELLENGDWELGIDDDFECNPYSPRATQLQEALELAEEYNVACNVIMAPHYMLDYVTAKYYDDGMAYPAPSMFFKYNINYPVAREIIETHLRNEVALLKNYSSVSDIVLTNEPVFITATYVPEFYQDRWSQYLEEVYDGDISKLNAVYGTEYTSFDQVLLSKIHVDSQLPESYDYTQFNDMIFAEYHEWMANIIHEVWPEVPISTKHMQIAHYDETYRWTGTYIGTDQVLLSRFSQINGCDAGVMWDSIADGTASPLEVSMEYDFMLGTKEAPVGNTENHIIPDGDTNYVDDQTSVVGSTLWQGAIHGLANSAVWIWQRSYNTDYIDYGSILFRPDCLYTVGKGSMDLNRLAYEVQAIQKQPAHVSLLYTQTSRLYSKTYMNAVHQTYAANMYNGVKVKFVHEDVDQTEKMHDTEILLAPAAYNVKDETVAEIAKFIRNGGKVVTIGDEAKMFAFNEYNVPRNSEDLDYIRQNMIHIPGVEDNMYLVSPTIPELQDKLADIYKDYDFRKIMVVDADTGERLEEVEWEGAPYGGGTVVNIVNNTLGQPKNINVYIDGEKVTDAYELRDQLELGESWTLEPFKPILIKTALTIDGQEEEPKPDDDKETEENNNSSTNSRPSGSGGSSHSGNGGGTLGWGGSGSSSSGSGSAGGTTAGSTGTSAPAADTAMKDMTGHWASEYVSELQSKGILNGYEDGNFYPENNVTRAEFAKIIAGALGIAADTSGEVLFSDVPAGEWFQPWVNAMSKAGLITGYDGAFDPNAPITREDMATIIYRALLYKGITLNGTSSFADSSAIASYAAEAVGALAEGGILTGFDGRFNPKDNTTRAEAATVVSRVLKTLG